MRWVYRINTLCNFVSNSSFTSYIVYKGSWLDIISIMAQLFACLPSTSVLWTRLFLLLDLSFYPISYNSLCRMLWWGIEEAAGETAIVDFGSGILLIVISASIKMTLRLFYNDMYYILTDYQIKTDYIQMRIESVVPRGIGMLSYQYLRRLPLLCVVWQSNRHHNLPYNPIYRVKT